MMLYYIYISLSKIINKEFWKLENNRLHQTCSMKNDDEPYLNERNTKSLKRTLIHLKQFFTRREPCMKWTKRVKSFYLYIHICMVLMHDLKHLKLKGLRMDSLRLHFIGFVEKKSQVWKFINLSIYQDHSSKYINKEGNDQFLHKPDIESQVISFPF